MKKSMFVVVVIGFILATFYAPYELSRLILVYYSQAHILFLDELALIWIGYLAGLSTLAYTSWKSLEK